MSIEITINDAMYWECALFNHARSFDTPVACYAWDTARNTGLSNAREIVHLEFIRPIGNEYPFVVRDCNGTLLEYKHCALLTSKHAVVRRATNREIAEWLSKGNGYIITDTGMASTTHAYTYAEADAPCHASITNIVYWHNTIAMPPFEYNLRIRK